VPCRYSNRRFTPPVYAGQPGRLVRCRASVQPLAVPPCHPCRPSARVCGAYYALC
jgi:hypothetical protein